MARTKQAANNSKARKSAYAPPPAARLPSKPPPPSNHHSNTSFASSTNLGQGHSTGRPSNRSLASRITGRERSYSPPRDINSSQPFRFGQRDSYRRSRSPMRSSAPRYDLHRPRDRTPPREVD